MEKSHFTSQRVEDIFDDFHFKPKTSFVKKREREKAVELERQAFNLRNSFTTKAATNETLFANRQIEVKKPRMKGGIML